MEPDKLFLIYQLQVMSEADRLGIVNHEHYIDMIRKIVQSFIDIYGVKQDE